MVAGAAQPKWDILEAVILLDGYVALLNGKQNRQQTIKDVSMQLRKMANNKGQAIDDETPIHLAAELDVIEAAISTAATELAMHKCQAFVIASDHGSSRLAVIKRQEVPYDTDTKGEHSGRCCKTFENCNLQYKVEENEYIALADYGRFRGSRAANVEVHGGASLEEIIVPVITLTLKKQLGIQIKVMNPDDITADRHSGVALTIYISDVEDPNRVKLIIDNKTYLGKTEDGLHFTFELKDIKRARTAPYTADVFDSDDLIGNISFKVKAAITKARDRKLAMTKQLAPVHGGTRRMWHMRSRKKSIRHLPTGYVT